MPRKAIRKPAGGMVLTAQRLKLVDEFAALDQELAEVKPRILRYQKLRELILDWYGDVPPEEEITIPGTSCVIVVSARDQIRAVTNEGKRKLFRLWGPREFVARALVLLKSLPDPKDEAGLYTVQALTGPRHLHVAAKRAHVANPAA